MRLCNAHHSGEPFDLRGLWDFAFVFALIFFSNSNVEPCGLLALFQPQHGTMTQRSNVAGAVVGQKSEALREFFLSRLNWQKCCSITWPSAHCGCGRHFWFQWLPMVGLQRVKLCVVVVVDVIVWQILSTLFKLFLYLFVIEFFTLFRSKLGSSFLRNSSLYFSTAAATAPAIASLKRWDKTVLRCVCLQLSFVELGGSSLRWVFFLVSFLFFFLFLLKHLLADVRAALEELDSRTSAPSFSSCFQYWGFLFVSFSRR